MGGRGAYSSNKANIKNEGSEKIVISKLTNNGITRTAIAKYVTAKGKKQK